MPRLLHCSIIGLLVLGLVGCGGLENKSHPAYEPIPPIVYEQPTQGYTPGSLYSNKRGISLFADTRAVEIGDILSVVLLESTSAAKSADTDFSKDQGVSVDPPTLFGQPFGFGTLDRYDLSQSINSGVEFSGQGSSNQSNSLTGSIAVQVSQILPNGNLVVQGEKWIKLNQGNEFIQLRGIVRPEDISAGNQVPSTLVADARISYGGEGAIESSNSPGWFTRFFNSPWMPF
jgi:flagellar L-ring protein precursor FlgH